MDPERIEIKPSRESEYIWIHQISNEKGILFSDGTYTAGQKHWNESVKAWLARCIERKKNPTFTFV